MKKVVVTGSGKTVLEQPGFSGLARPEEEKGSRIASQVKRPLDIHMENIILFAKYRNCAAVKSNNSATVLRLFLSFGELAQVGKEGGVQGAAQLRFDSLTFDAILHDKIYLEAPLIAIRDRRKKKLDIFYNMCDNAIEIRFA